MSNFDYMKACGILDAIDLAEQVVTSEGVIILLLRKRIESLVKEQKNG